jgi:hypothetical protein
MLHGRTTTGKYELLKLSVFIMDYKRLNNSVNNKTNE